MNGKWESRFGFEMPCVSVGQINRKGYQDNEQGTGPLLYVTAVVVASRRRTGGRFLYGLNYYDKRTNKK